jgi:hypothetical protein
MRETTGSVKLSHVPQPPGHSVRQPLEERGEAQQFVVYDEPDRSLPSLARILKLEDHPFVLEEQGDPYVEEADRG